MIGLEVTRLDRHVFRSTESELYKYPGYVKEYRLRKRYIEDVATCGNSPGDGGEPVDGGPLRIPDLQKAVEKADEDRRLKNLAERMEPIEEAIGLLKETLPDHWRLVELKYFKGRGWAEIGEALHLARSRIFDVRREAIENIAPILWGPYARDK